MRCALPAVSARPAAHRFRREAGYGASGGALGESFATHGRVAPPAPNSSETGRHLLHAGLHRTLSDSTGHSGRDHLIDGARRQGVSAVESTGTALGGGFRDGAAHHALDHLIFHPSLRLPARFLDGSRQRPRARVAQ